MLTRGGVNRGRRSGRGCQSRRLFHCVHALLVLVFLERPAVSFAVTFPVTVVTDHLCIKVRRKILLLVLALVPALLSLGFVLALVDSADVCWRQACQCVTGHDVSDLLSHKRIN